MDDEGEGGVLTTYFCLVTVKTEIFARVFLKFFFVIYAKFRENSEITLSFTSIDKSGTSCDFIASQICL